MAAAAAAADDSAAWQLGRTERPFSRLMEPLYPPWQLVQEAEESDRRISNLNTVSAEDAKLIMKRCRQLKNRALAQMDQQYKAKVRRRRGGGRGGRRHAGVRSAKRLVSVGWVNGWPVNYWRGGHRFVSWG